MLRAKSPTLLLPVCSASPHNSRLKTARNVGLNIGSLSEAEHISFCQNISQILPLIFSKKTTNLSLALKYAILAKFITSSESAI